MFQGMLAVLALAAQLVRPALTQSRDLRVLRLVPPWDALTVMKEKSLQGAPHIDNL